MDRAISRFADAVEDYRPIWPVIADDFYALETAQFASEGDEGGIAWPALSPAYQEAKERRYPGKPILQRTGELEKSLTSATDANAVHIAERKALTLGTRVPYAIYHQSTRPRRRLPRRPEIVLTEDFKRDAMRNVHVFLVEMGTHAGFRAGLAPTAVTELSRYFGRGIPPRGTSPRRSADGGHWNF